MSTKITYYITNTKARIQAGPKRCVITYHARWSEARSGIKLTCHSDMRHLLEFDDYELHDYLADLREQVLFKQRGQDILFDGNTWRITEAGHIVR